MKLLIFLLCLVSFSSLAITEEQIYNPPVYLTGFYANAKFNKVIDGDTVDFTFNVDDKEINLRCRVYGIDTPESQLGRKLTSDVRGTNFTKQYELSAGKLSKHYTEDYFSSKEFWNIHNYGQDMYGRTLCLIENFNFDILKDGYAVLYKKGHYLIDPNLLSMLEKYQQLGINQGLNVKYKDLMVHLRNK